MCDSSSDSDEAMSLEPQRYTVGRVWYTQREGLWLAVLHSCFREYQRLVPAPMTSKADAWDACRAKWKIISQDILSRFNILISPNDIKRFSLAALAHSTPHRTTAQ